MSKDPHLTSTQIDSLDGNEDDDDDDDERPLPSPIYRLSDPSVICHLSLFAVLNLHVMKPNLSLLVVDVRQSV